MQDELKPCESKKVERFEDLIAWQKARELTGEIYKTTKSGEFAKDFGLRDQIRRAAVSIMSNLAEGFERGRTTEFHQYLSIAKGSCAEVRSQLYVAWDAEYLERDNFVSLMQTAREVGKIIGGLRKSIENKRDEK
ncbi:MAG TPA: four helix bundle protein [Pyrinomonadaceae bacterium]|nr:four helix bundle protein [Pyrinomonadaceae bacterium]